MRRKIFNTIKVTINNTTKMENILKVKNRRELSRSGMISVDFCVLAKFRFNGLNDV